MEILTDGGKLLGLDIGFRNIKVFPEGKNHSKTVTYCNAVGGAPVQRIGDLEQLPVEERLVFENGFSLGRWAINFGRARHRIDANWLLSEAWYHNFLGACAVAGVEDGDRIVAAIPIPLNEYAAYAPRLKKKLTGIHSFHLRGREPVSFEVLPVIVAQLISGVYHQAFNISGHLQKDFDQGKNRLVIDPGGGTLGSAVLNGLSNNPDFIGSVPRSGYWEVINACKSSIEECFEGADTSALVLADGVERKKWKHYGVEHDISELIEEKERELVAAHRQQLEQYPLETVDEVLVIGGTGERLFDLYEEAFKPLTVTLGDNPRIANVVGAVKQVRSLLLGG